MFEYLVFNEEEFQSWNRELRIDVSGRDILFRRTGNDYGFKGGMAEGRYNGNPEEFVSVLEAFHVERWKDEYSEPVLDGHSWTLRYKEVGKPCRKIAGYNAFPECFGKFVKHLFSVTREVRMLDYLRYTESENGVLFRKYEMRVRDGSLFYKFTGPYYSEEERGEHVYDGDAYAYSKKLEMTGFKLWDSSRFTDNTMLDGIDWILEYKYTGEGSVMICGSNKGPKNIQEFVFALNPENSRIDHVEI